MSPAYYVVGILGLAVLMVVHESGHYFAARRFGMRVIRFSIGFGPRLYKHQPEGSPTVFQIALIPFLAYVQIAGMNPYEESDPKDKGSYQNASLWARVCTIAAGPLANYFFASVLFFVGFLLAGRTIEDRASMRIITHPEGPAHAADMRDNDKILGVNGEQVHTWEELTHAISGHAGEPIDVLVERDGAPAPIHITVTPKPKGDENAGKIMIGPPVRTESVGVAEAARLSVVEPPKVVADTVIGLIHWITGKEKVQAAGPVGMAKMAAAAAKSGAGDLFKFLGVLSAYLGGFNLLPVPALDGGRLLFLGFEAASRRKPDAKVEAQVHAVGLLMLLCVIGFVTYYFDITKH
jgi:regulator of sigma E protease